MLCCRLFSRCFNEFVVLNRAAAIAPWCRAGVWGGVAATGIFHYLSGTAGFSILIAAISEMILALVFFVASRQMRHV